MLIEFEVGNFMSFKSPVRLSMQAAAPIKEYLDENTFQAGRYRLLKSAAVYGANASGKSNLLAAMSFMQWFVASSSKETQVEEEVGVVPFKLDAATENAPSRFEVCFMLEEVLYRYGFEVDRHAVRREWLLRAEKAKEEALFLREGGDIEVLRSFAEGEGLEEKTRDNALFLSVVAQFNGAVATAIVKWFRGFRTLYGSRDANYERYTATCLQDPTLHALLVRFIREADVGIEDLTVSEAPADEQAPKSLGEQPGTSRRQKRFTISAVHRRFRDGRPDGVTMLNLADEESEGTRKFLRLAGPIVDCLQKGYVVSVDELDSKLHPLLTKAIVRLFNSKESNPKNAQLIFVTHDTNLLQYGKLRRDQVWFTEKTEQAATALYSLAEFKSPDGAKVRNDAAFEKNYILGRYGAIPYLGDFELLLKETDHGQADETKRP